MIRKYKKWHTYLTPRVSSIPTANIIQMCNLNHCETLSVSKVSSNLKEQEEKGKTPKIRSNNQKLDQAIKTKSNTQK